MTREHNAGVLRLIAEDAGPGVVGVARPVTTTLRGPWRDVARLGIAKRAVRLEGFEPPPTQIRSLRLYPLSYRRTLRRNSRHGEFLPSVYHCLGCLASLSRTVPTKPGLNSRWTHPE